MRILLFFVNVFYSCDDPHKLHRLFPSLSVSLSLSIYSLSLGWVAVTWGISAHNFISDTHTHTHSSRGSWQAASTSRWPVGKYFGISSSSYCSPSLPGEMFSLPLLLANIQNHMYVVCEVSAYKVMLGICFAYTTRLQKKKKKWANK